MPLLVIGPENPENEPVLGRHTLRHEMEASSLQEIPDSSESMEAVETT